MYGIPQLAAQYTLPATKHCFPDKLPCQLLRKPARYTLRSQRAGCALVSITMQLVAVRAPSIPAPSAGHRGLIYASGECADARPSAHPTGRKCMTMLKQGVLRCQALSVFQLRLHSS